MTGRSHGAEFPGFRIPGAPIFNGAHDTAMFAGDIAEPVAVLDLAMVFGSRLWGHQGAPTVLDAAPVLAPGLGDLYSHHLRERANFAVCDRVAQELGEDPDDWRALILHTGSEAVETALKTALRATGRTRVVAFEGGYHGTFGLALAVTHAPRFREPWQAQYASDTVRWEPWGEAPHLADDVACVIVEPWQGRSGVLSPPDGFHAALRAECDRVGALLVLDAVLCGAGRTGATLATCLTEARPDAVCLGKAIGCGAVASVAVVHRQVAEDAWSKGAVEPAHTSTSIGAPEACIGVLAALDRLTTRAVDLDAADAAWRSVLGPLAERIGAQLRGIGSMWALDWNEPGRGALVAERLREDHRILVVPSGAASSSITLLPAVTTSPGERERFANALEELYGHDPA